ncbi:MAG: hypothetical protein OHK0022_09030 [Roseiflexaceae bacterium]
MIINRIGLLANARGISVRDLSQRARITYNTALGLVRGTPTRIDLDVLDRVCEVLDVQPGDVLVRVSKPREE